MKKILNVCVAILLLATACNKPKENQYIVTAKIDGVNNGTNVYLKKVSFSAPIQEVDTTQVQDGSFTFTGESTEPQMHFIFIDGVKGNVPVILEEGNITLELYKDSLNASKISGTPSNDSFTKFLEGTKAINKKLVSLREDLFKAQRENDTTTMSSLRDEFFEIQEEGKNYELNFAENNPDSYVTLMLIHRYLLNKAHSTNKVKELYDNLPEALKNSEEGKEVAKLLTDALKVEVGSKAPNFSAPNPEGKTIALNDVKGKVTIIDFWAAWCKPCRAENPNVVKVYNKYHEKGLEIIGVSLDKNKEDWEKAIADDGLPWHHVSNLKHWNEPVARMYNVNAIPATFILNEEGVIVAKDLRGDALEEKIAELLN